MHNLWVLLFFQKSLFAEDYFLIAAINLTARIPLYTCLVYIALTFHLLLKWDFENGL